jgi:hypothetical protein
MNVADQLAQQARILRQQQMTQITSMPSLAYLPDPDQCLKYCQSIMTRRKAHLMVHPSELSKLREWYETPGGFPILLAYGRGLRTVARDFAVGFLETLRASGVPTVWVLSHTTSDLKSGASITDILLSLSIQALLLNPQALDEGTNPISSHHFQNAFTEDQGFKLLDRCVNGISNLYIILDIAVVNAAVDYHDMLVNSFVQKFLNLVLNKSQRGIKLIIAVEELNRIFDVEEQELLDSSSIFVDGRSPTLKSRTRGCRGLTRYSSHVFPLRSGTKGITNWLSRQADVSNK